VENAVNYFNFLTETKLTKSQMIQVSWPKIQFPRSGNSKILHCEIWLKAAFVNFKTLPIIQMQVTETMNIPSQKKKGLD
jgi:hypothetical protein